jgi:hypothetical protein
MDRQMAGVKGVKKRITYALTTNANSTEMLLPLIIGKAARPRAFKKKTAAQLGFLYRHNAKAWTTAKLYQEWLKDLDSNMRAQKRHILLLQDNFSGHKVPKNLTNVVVENFFPNLTVHIQPMDAGIIRYFKAHFCRLSMQRALDRYNEGVTPVNIYNIEQLQVMRLTEQAWDKGTRETVAHCWRKSGILPTTDTVASANGKDVDSDSPESCVPRGFCEQHHRCSCRFCTPASGSCLG